ncbi:MAG TPA: hypothetical protein VFG87_27555 [Amycolatopsis sp.]|nr:hypothetical protein [Amycolatopsis sp.]
MSSPGRQQPHGHTDGAPTGPHTSDTAGAGGDDGARAAGEAVAETATSETSAVSAGDTAAEPTALEALLGAAVVDGVEGDGDAGAGEHTPGKTGPSVRQRSAARRKGAGPAKRPKPLTRPNPVAVTLLVIGGLAGVLQYFLPWFSTAGYSVTGGDIAGLARQVSTVSGDATLVEAGIAAVLIDGALVVLLGGVSVIPMRGRRLLGAVSLVLSLVMAAGAACVLISGMGAIDTASVGYYLFLFAGIPAVIGSIVTLVRG